MNIGIIGSGNMGRAIGVRLAALGHTIMFGARRSEQAEAARRLAGENSMAGTNDEAATFGELLIWTMREPDPSMVLNDPAALRGKIVVDLNNRGYGDVREGRWFEKAIAEQLQENAPDSEVVKAFNTIPMEGFDRDPDELLNSGGTTFLAGGSNDTRAKVGEIAMALGFRPVDLGAGTAALRAAEALGDAIRMILIDGTEEGVAHLAITKLPVGAMGLVGRRENSKYG